MTAEAHHKGLQPQVLAQMHLKPHHMCQAQQHLQA